MIVALPFLKAQTAKFIKATSLAFGHGGRAFPRELKVRSVRPALNQVLEKTFLFLRPRRVVARCSLTILSLDGPEAGLIEGMPKAST